MPASALHSHERFPPLPQGETAFSPDPAAASFAVAFVLARLSCASL